MKLRSLAPGAVGAIDLVLQFRWMTLARIERSVRLLVEARDLCSEIRLKALKSMLEWNLRRAG